jgi:glucokinase
VGSSSLANGRIVESPPGMPPGGRIHRLEVDGRPLEDLMSRRALRLAYRTRGGDAEADVADIARHARAGEAAAHDVLAHALRGLGRAVTPWLREFGADVLVVGGSMTRSWDIFEPLLVEGIGVDVPVVVARDPEASALAGAALSALRSRDAD